MNCLCNPFCQKSVFFHQKWFSCSPVMQLEWEYHHFNPNTNIVRSVISWNFRILDVSLLYSCSLNMGSWTFDWDSIGFLWSHPWNSTEYSFLFFNIFLVCISSLLPQCRTNIQGTFVGKDELHCFVLWAQWQGKKFYFAQERF